MELKIIVESKNFENDKQISETLQDNPCKLCFLGQGMMCAKRIVCRWKTHKEIFIKKEVTYSNGLLNNMHDEMLEELKIFVERVEKGEVRSKRTYERFKELIEKAKNV